MVHCATLQLVITTVVVILYLIRDGTSCEFEDCTTVQQHINATGENLITFEPCLVPVCVQHCWTQYDIVAVNLLSNTSSQPDQEVKLYWNSLEVLLMILPGSGTASNALEPYDMVVDIEYVCHERSEHKETLKITITLKPISIELHTNIKHHEVKEGHPLELDCIIRGAIDDTENVKAIIHHESEELNCTYKESQNKIMCTRIIPSFSEADSGKYFCSTTIGDEYFSSKMKDIKLDNSTNGLGMPIKIAIGGGAFGVVVVIILIISLVVSIVINYNLKKQLTQRNDGRLQQQGNGVGAAPACNGIEEEEPLIPEENHPPHSYEAVADDLERSGAGLRDSPHSNTSSGSRTSEFVRTNQDGEPSKLASIHQSAGASNKPTSSPQVLKEGNQDTGF